MGAYVKGVYVPAHDELGYDVAKLTDTLTRLGEQGVNVMAAPYAAAGDDSVDDGAAIAAAVADAGVGGTVIFPKPPVAYKSSVSLVPLDGQKWMFAGRRVYGGTGGVRIHYTGTGAAIDLTDVDSWSASDFMVDCTGTGAIGLKLKDTGSGSYNHSIKRVVLKGPGVGSGTAIQMSGQLTCNCHNVFETVYIRDWLFGMQISGYSNANVFGNIAISVCGTAIALGKIGSDTKAGDDNEFNRVEIDGSTPTGITLADTAQRNLFIKCVMDGVGTTGLTLTSTCANNVFLVCTISPTLSDLGAQTTFLACYGSALTAPQDFLLRHNGLSFYKSTVFSGTLATDAHFDVYGSLRAHGALQHDGSTAGFFGHAPSSRASAYTITNLTNDRTFDADATSTAELADVLGTLINDLKSYGLLQ